MIVDHRIGSAFAILKRQFEAAASEYPRLNDLLLETPDNQREMLNGPFPVDGCRTLEEAIGTHANASEITFRIKDSFNENIKVAKLLGARAFQYGATYISGNYRPIDVFHHYSNGRDQFRRLADQAGELLVLLPAKIINAYPSDWKQFEKHLSIHRIREGVPSSDSGKPDDSNRVRSYDAILPPGDAGADRWINFLHWLGWRGDVPGLKSRRRTWIGSTTFPWVPSIEEFDRSTRSFPPLAKYTFDETRHFFSVIENIFLCSALAINAIEGQLLHSEDTIEGAEKIPTPVPIPIVVQAENGSNDRNLLWLLMLIEKADSGSSEAKWELSQIREYPEIQVLSEQNGITLHGKFSPSTVHAIAVRLGIQCSIDKQEVYRFSLSTVIDFLRDRTKTKPSEAFMVDAKNVFVIHGRNGPARNAMFDFLRAIGLNPIEWGEAVKMTGKGAPYVGEILDAAFSSAQAVVAILTGDDLTYLRKELQETHESEQEKTPTPQARPNVLFETGMAFGRHPERTIMVEIGNLRPFSDVAGRHTLHFRGTPEHRSELRERLKSAKCAVKDAGVDWLKAGNFDEALRLATASASTRKKKP